MKITDKKNSGKGALIIIDKESKSLCPLKNTTFCAIYQLGYYLKQTADMILECWGFNVKRSK